MTGISLEPIFTYIVPRWRIVTCFLLVFFTAHFSFGQNTDDASDDAIVVVVDVKGIGAAEMPAIIRNNDIFLPVNSVFDFLKVKNTLSPSLDTLSGFYVNQSDNYLIDRIHNKIFFKDSVINVQPGELLKDDNNLYLHLKYFKTIFGLNGNFNFRRLAVTFTSDIEFLAIKEARQEMMRRNISKLKGEIKADTTIKRMYPGLSITAADWAVTSTQQSQGSSETRFSLGIGSVIAGGEANVSLNYYTSTQFSEKQQYFQWRFVNNDNPYLRQVIAGTIYAQSISTLYAPVVGIQFTNASTTYRKSYGTYTLSNTTEPNWVVELYVNGVLVDYKKTDASGFYTFEVPLIYGYSIIKLRFYGPNGEERTQQSYINIPFNFIPVHQFEYVASAGVVEDGRNSIFSRGAVNYGLSNRLTIGGGVEYLSSVTSGTTMPFVNTSIKLASRLLISGEYTYGVRKRGVLNYRLPTNLQIDIDYINYEKGQTAIYYNYLKERKVILSMPVHAKYMSMFSRFTLDRITVPTTTYTNAELSFTGTVKTVGLNFSNYASFVRTATPYLYGLFSMSFTLPAKIIFTAQLQYDYKLNQPVFMKYSFEKHLFGNGFVNIAYQEFFNATGLESFTGNYRNIIVGLRYDFSFTRLSFSSLNDNNGGYTRVEAASGSFLYDHKTGYFNVNNRTNVGKAEIELEPFLDINCNGVRDTAEPRVQDLLVQLNGGRVIYCAKDTMIRILDLEPYVSYYLDLSRNSFDNISWQIKNRIVKVTVTPNNFTLIQVPVAVVGEVSGTVSIDDRTGNGQKGEGQIIVNVYDSATSKLVVHTITESDGYFNYLGLAPGSYILQVDSAQLQKLHLRAERPDIPIHITGSREGDIADGVEFVLVPLSKDTVQPAAKADKDSVVTPVTKIEKAAKEDGIEILAEKGTYTIQVCAVYSEADAKKVQAYLIKNFHRKVAIVRRGRFYKPRIIGFPKKKDAVKFLPKLLSKGRNKGSFIVKLLYPIYK